MSDTEDSEEKKIPVIAVDCPECGMSFYIPANPDDCNEYINYDCPYCGLSY